MDSYDPNVCKWLFARYEQGIDEHRWNVLQGLKLPDHPNHVLTEEGVLEEIPEGYNRVEVDPRWLSKHMCPPRIDQEKLAARGALHVEKWCEKSSSLWLTIKDVLEMPLGVEVPVLPFDRNMMDIVDGNAAVERGEDYAPCVFFNANKSFFTPIAGRGGMLGGKLRLPGVDTNDEFEFDIEYAPGCYLPLKDGDVCVDGEKKHWMTFAADTTHVGWRGPMMSWDDVEYMPRVYHGSNPYGLK